MRRRTWSPCLARAAARRSRTYYRCCPTPRPLNHHLQGKHQHQEHQEQEQGGERKLRRSLWR
jgi:hypothetical protein